MSALAGQAVPSTSMASAAEQVALEATLNARQLFEDMAQSVLVSEVAVSAHCCMQEKLAQAMVRAGMVPTGSTEPAHCHRRVYGSNTALILMAGSYVLDHLTETAYCLMTQLHIEQGPTHVRMRLSASTTRSGAILPAAVFDGLRKEWPCDTPLMAVQAETLALLATYQVVFASDAPFDAMAERTSNEKMP